MNEEFILTYLICALVIIVSSKKLYSHFKEKIFLKELVKSDIRIIDKMDGHQFEVYLKALLRELGYKAKVTPKSRDFGADLVLLGKKRIVVQAKRYNLKNKVGINAVQEIYAAQRYYKAQESWIITNSMYTKPAIQLAKACNVKLVDRYELVRFINSIESNVTPDQVYKKVEPAERKCVCGEKMIVRISNGDRFFGCSNFPVCKHTEPLNKAK